MAPIAKENEISTARAEPPRTRPATLPGDTASKPQPVALEVPVTVNGARTVDGSDKREPFSESTKTILVFGHGAVIRLEASVASGQLLFLTNEKTKKEVVCQVVKSKNYRSVSGYVELEFTEPVVGFWGMRFPGDRIGPQSQTAGAPAKAAEAKPAVVPPAPKAELQPAAAPKKPDAAANFNALKAMMPSSSASETAPVLPPKTTELAKPGSLAGSAPVEAKPLAPMTPSAPVKAPAPVASDPRTEALKQQTARLQEELSSMLFTDAPAGKPKARSEAADPKESDDAAAKVLEFATQPPVKPAPAPTVTETPSSAAPPAQRKTAVPASASSMQQEELKIPSWLEPLARNAASPVPVQEASAKPDVFKEAPIFEEHIASELPTSTESPSGPFTTTFSGGLLTENSSLGAAGAEPGSSKGLKFLAVAAGVLLAATAGVWYARNQKPAAPATVVAASTTPSPLRNADATGPTTPSTSNRPAAPVPAPIASSTARTARTNAGGGASAPSAGNSSQHSLLAPVQPASRPSAQEKTASEAHAKVEEQPKKPSLGAVRLATPTLKRRQAQNSSEAIPTVELGGGEPVSAGLGERFASNDKQPAAPAAPIPVGGDVKPAKLISSVAPIYPALAKTQHVAGDVRIDALIDASGRVTTMKVVSGPTLLQQSAMEALRQWRYQPATLDGKAVAMHLTVSIQFRLQ